MKRIPGFISPDTVLKKTNSYYYMPIKPNKLVIGEVVPQANCDLYCNAKVGNCSPCIEGNIRECISCLGPDWDRCKGCFN
ncbi:hypothetical protein C6Y54_18110 [Bacillus cereus]|nr:hypothetical protein C6Y54_18110 [Bacillus cereus]